MKQLAFLQRLLDRIDPDLDKKERSQILRQLLLDEMHDILPASILPMNGNYNVFDPDATGGRNRVGYTDEKKTDMYAKQKKRRRMSVFEGSLAEIIIRMWSDPGDVVLDPFTGRLCRMVKTIEANRLYWGFDVSQDACRYNTEEIIARSWQKKAQIVNGSVLTHPHRLPAMGCDMIFTCPPYGSSEFYGDNMGVEGIRHYGEFLEELAAILALSVDTLKPDCYAVIVVKDWFQHRQMVSFHSDMIKIMTSLGLVQWDCIAKEMSGLRKMFHRDIVQLRRSAQTHEYVLVFRNSDRRKAKDKYRQHCLKANTRREKEHAAMREKALAVLAERGIKEGELWPYLKRMEMV